ncbi:MAG: SH3 domain-containing protein [Bacteriovoracaceae bacterium]|nr:SH3 domain-containing protein [Bacteriovoracaceae bacterium]
MIKVLSQAAVILIFLSSSSHAFFYKKTTTATTPKKQGWVFGKYVVNDKVSVSSRGLILRDAPNSSGKVLGLLPNGTQVEIIDSTDEWKKVAVGSVSVTVSKPKLAPRSKSKWTRSYTFHLRSSLGPNKGEIKDESLIQSTLKSFFGFGGRVNFDYKRSRGHVRYAFDFEYYKYADIQNVSLPATYHVDFTVVYMNYCKTISPLVTISYESISALGGLLQDDDSIERVGYNLKVFWFGVGANFKTKLPKFLKRKDVDITASMLLSIIGTPSQDYLSGSSSGNKIKLSAKIHTSRRIFVDAMILQNTLNGHASINNTEYVLRLGYKF